MSKLGTYGILGAGFLYFLLIISVWAGLGYVAWHFISKFW